MGLRDHLETLLAEKRVLLVGAGGIGCELLKNLVLSGFKNIHVVDLDTIDVSNLNRQFLFRREHISKSKAEVASSAVKKLQPNVNITFDHDSIFNSDKFGVPSFKNFDLVMNALDNRAARNHVNRLCLSAGVPLIESGSAGYLGQVSVIIKGQTECYECTAKRDAAKTYPGCTIRNTPSEHIHCTVWSKHCFNQLFGEIDIDDDVSPDLNDPENKSEELIVENGVMNGNGTSHTENDENTKEMPVVIANTRKWAEECGYDAKLIFNKLFFTDIEYLLKMKDLWKSRKRPAPLTWEDIMEDQHSGGSTDMTEDQNDVMKQWTIKTCAQAFVDAIGALKTRKNNLPDREVLTWDKDDTDAMKFVAATANLRAHIFGIPGKSLFDIKAMAGNIIAAIATTNAIVAGMVVIEAIKVLRGQNERIRSVFINQQPNPRGQLLMDQLPDVPRKDCIICSTDIREVFVRVNLAKMTLKSFKETVLINYYSVQSPDVIVLATGSIIISSDPEDDFSEIESRTCNENHLSHGARLEVDDYLQELKFRVILLHDETLGSEQFRVDGGDHLDNDRLDVESRKRKSETSGTLIDEQNEETGVKRMRIETE